METPGGHIPVSAGIEESSASWTECLHFCQRVPYVSSESAAVGTDTCQVQREYAVASRRKNKYMVTRVNARLRNIYTVVKALKVNETWITRQERCESLDGLFGASFPNRFKVRRRR